MRYSYVCTLSYGCPPWRMPCRGKESRFERRFIAPWQASFRNSPTLGPYFISSPTGRVPTIRRNFSPLTPIFTPAKAFWISTGDKARKLCDYPDNVACCIFGDCVGTPEWSTIPFFQKNSKPEKNINDQRVLIGQINFLKYSTEKSTQGTVGVLPIAGEEARC